MSCSEPAWSCRSLLALGLCLIAGGCKPNLEPARPSGGVTPASHAEPRAAEAPARASPTATPTTPELSPALKLHLPSEQDFVLPEEGPLDKAESARALRHNCCDEMPAKEIEAHVDGAPARRPAERR